MLDSCTAINKSTAAAVAADSLFRHAAAAAAAAVRWSIVQKEGQPMSHMPI